MANNCQSKFMLYNTMSKKKKFFEPKVPGKVDMYICGVTTYDFSHIGHARAYVAFDVLYRYLKYLGYEVNYVRNFTDIDDKIIKRANEKNEDPLDLSKRFCDEFLVDMDALQCLSPSTQPRVTEHIEDIVEMIAKIIENDFAYTVDGDVYFAVDKFPTYGRLSGRKLEDNRAGERVAVDSRKRNPADFALWKAAKPGEPSWDSPWGLGRPGWHIECSAMSARYLGHSFDIHGGGMDLTFPHHENELAQSCAACSETHISYWVHNGFVTVDDEKMSKSQGNFFTIRTVLKEYHPLALRYFLMNMHYRSPVNYSLAQLEIASDAVFYIYQTLQDCEEALLPLQEGNSDDKPKKTIEIPPDAKKCIDKLKNDFQDKMSDDAKKCIDKLKNDFHDKMSDDLHAPHILNVSLQETFRFINGFVTELKTLQDCEEALLPLQEGNSDDKPKKTIKIPPNAKKCIHKLKNILDVSLQETFRFINGSVTELMKQMIKQQQLAIVQGLTKVVGQVKQVLEVLGLLSTLPYPEVLKQLKEKALIRAGKTEEYVLQQIRERAEARENKEYKRSDQIRTHLTTLGIALMDVGKDNTIWRPCVPGGGEEANASTSTH